MKLKLGIFGLCLILGFNAAQAASINTTRSNIKRVSLAADSWCFITNVSDSEEVAIVEVRLSRDGTGCDGKTPMDVLDYELGLVVEKTIPADEKLGTPAINVVSATSAVSLSMTGPVRGVQAGMCEVRESQAKKKIYVGNLPFSQTDEVVILTLPPEIQAQVDNVARLVKRSIVIIRAPANRTVSSNDVHHN